MSQSKRPRKKPPETLDWRELAEGPALRGLAEVLGASSSEGVAPTEYEKKSSQAFPALDIHKDAESVPPGGESTAEGVSPTVAGTSAVVLTSAALSKPKQAPSEGEANTVVQSPSVGSTDESPTEGDKPSVDHTKVLSEALTVGVSPTGMIGWKTADGAFFEVHRAQRISAARHSLGLGEERVYQALWQATETEGVYQEGEGTKIFSLGYDRIAHLVRLNEKSVRILLPKLIVKKVLEIVAAENSAAQTGRTYRIFSEEKVLERQREAHLLFVVKNGRAVEFVHPIISPTVGVAPSVGVPARNRF